LIAPLMAIALAACSVAPSDVPVAPLDPDVAVDCGPVADPTLCRLAVAVAATAKVNPPPIVAAQIRRPVPDDSCTEWLHACGPDAVIVVIQSGDTLQEIPLVRSADGWVRLDLVR
jgi:hypothetical protein